MKNRNYVRQSFTLSLLVSVGFVPVMASANDYLNYYDKVQDLMKNSEGTEIQETSLDMQTVLLKSLPNDQQMDSTKRSLHAARDLLDAEPEISFRGESSIRVYKDAAPAVVMITTDDGIGSGALLNDSGEIITNWHVVGSQPQVQVFFMPDPDQTLNEDSAYLADVIRVSRTKDLALLQLRTTPEQLSSIELGSTEQVQVGQDVHAIGHPFGESWTYTLGIVSQIRNQYQWGANGRHNAKVVQTQTPINPGNSGGPLLNDDGKIIGINSFKAADGEGLNYAVSVEDVLEFLQGDSSEYQVDPSTQQRGDLFAGFVSGGLKVQHIDAYEADIDGNTKIDTVLTYDLNQNSTEDTQVVFFNEAEVGLVAYIDRNEDGYPDLIAVDTDSTGKPDEWVYDTNYDGQPDVVALDTDEDGTIDQMKHAN